ncbi:MAG: HEAT repeat domain-containing protein [Gemmatimonadaceae bacterium]
MKTYAAMLVAALLCDRGLQAQQLARRVASATGANVEFTYSARPGICGDGRTFIRVGTDMYMGRYYNNGGSPCDAGLARVLIVRVDKEPVRVEDYVGPVVHDPEATDLGRVPAAEAAAYLMQLASGDDGRVARDAITAAALADSTQITSQLLAIVKDQNKSRELRRNALNWVTRPGLDAGLPVQESIRVLTDIARDENEHQSMRQQAASQLGRFERGEGVPALITMANNESDPWLARQALDGLVRSGDPRARRAVREMVSNSKTPDELRSLAIGALVGEYATFKDADLIRDAYPRLTSDRARDAAIIAVASIGGEHARTWLSDLAKDRDQAMRQRRKAAEQLSRSGSSSAQIGSLYDAVDDVEVRSVLIDVLAQNGTRDAGAKLLSIAKSDPQLPSRRRAIGALARFEDPTIKNALRDLVERGAP